eukprot:8163025-Karenia_brevis.AAC.1
MNLVDANDDDDADGRGATGPEMENRAPSHIYFVYAYDDDEPSQRHAGTRSNHPRRGGPWIQ